VVVDELLEQNERRRVEPVSRDAEDPLFLMYTSGTTGQPKGCQHRTGGYVSYVTATSKNVLDIKPEDTYWCAADIGWITGHSYIVYGPLSLGTTSVMYEDTPDHPHKGRIWEIAERYDVDIFHTSPTAVRMFMKWGEQHIQDYDFGLPAHDDRRGADPARSVALVLQVHRRRGRRHRRHLVADRDGRAPHHEPAGPRRHETGSAGKALPGISPAIYDDNGEPIEPASGQAGNLVIEDPWPGMLQTVYGNDERFIEEYWQDFSDTDSDDPDDWVYKAGDGAVHGQDDYFRVLGRLDDVMNVAGHRLGTMELESAVAEVEDVAEAAVAAREDAEKGKYPTSTRRPA